MASNDVKIFAVKSGFILLFWMFSFFVTPCAGATENGRCDYSNGIPDHEYGQMESGERPERDWYEKEYESYESPYGYYEEDQLYDYRDRGLEKGAQDWYERRFRDYPYRGYSDH